MLSSSAASTAHSASVMGLWGLLDRQCQSQSHRVSKLRCLWALRPPARDRLCLEPKTSLRNPALRGPTKCYGAEQCFQACRFPRRVSHGWRRPYAPILTCRVTRHRLCCQGWNSSLTVRGDVDHRRGTKDDQMPKQLPWSNGQAGQDW